MGNLNRTFKSRQQTTINTKASERLAIRKRLVEDKKARVGSGVPTQNKVSTSSGLTKKDKHVASLPPTVQ